MPKTPHAYQDKAIDLCISRNALVLDDRGLGKTLEAIVSMHNVGGGLPKLVICNKTARTQWRAEILDQYPGSEVLVLDEVPIKARFQRDCWIVTHYWVVSTFYKVLSNNLFGAICVDECHRIKNKDTNIATGLKKLQTLRKIGLSGTPIEHGPRDFFSMLQWLYPEYYTSLWEFVSRYCELKDQYIPSMNTFKKKTTGRCSDPEGLARSIASFSIRRMKADVAPWLPPKNIMRIPVEMNDDQNALYQFMNSVTDIEAIDDDGEYYFIPNELSKLTKLHQIASSPVMVGKPYTGSKIKWLEDYINDNPSTRCIIVSRYRFNAIDIAHRLNAAIVVGGLEQGIEEFKSGKVKHLCGTIAALGESHSLPMADCIICVDQDYNSILMDQVIDRHHRINTTSQKDVIMLYVPNTVDELVLECIDNKWNENELIYEFMKGFNR